MFYWFKSTALKMSQLTDSQIIAKGKPLFWWWSWIQFRIGPAL